MENLRNLLSHFNSSEPLMAGALWQCRGNGDCLDWQDKEITAEIFMSGGGDSSSIYMMKIMMIMMMMVMILRMMMMIMRKILLMMM